MLQTYAAEALQLRNNPMREPNRLTVGSALARQSLAYSENTEDVRVNVIG